VPAETRGLEDHTGFSPAEGRALKQLQERFLQEFWSPEVRVTGVYDVPTKMAVIRAQHHARYEMNGRLDEKTWEYIQRMRP
jgi:hypothetical protein